MTTSGAADEPWQAGPARQLVTYPLDRFGDWTIRFEATDRDDVEEGSTRLRERTITIRVPAGWAVERTANALVHELGHVHDILHLDHRLRDRYLKARGLSWLERNGVVPWRSCITAEPRRRQRFGCEDFAEVFAFRWGPPAEFVSTVRPAPDAEALERLAPLLEPPGP
jgi:hypothetical protein